MLRKHLFSAWFFIVLDLFPDTFSACMRCVNFNFVYFWSYPDLFPHTEKRHLSYLSNILQKEKSAEKSALFPLLSLLPWHQYYALNVPRYPWIDNIRWLVSRRYVFGNKSAIFPFLGRSRVWMYILRQFVSMIWFVIESQELSFHAFLFDTIILVRIPEQTHFRWQNQND